MIRMEMRQLGGSGVSLSRVGLGGYELGPEPQEEPDVDRTAHVIGKAIEAGMNWLDTSENYLETRNESVIGAALAETDGDFLVATKVAPRASTTGGGSGFRRSQVHEACRASLRRLRREQIDVYFLHWPDDTGVPLEETWGAMAELAADGLVRAIGMSNYDLEDVERCHAQRPVDVVQVGLNLIDYLDDRTEVARLGNLGIPVTIYEPLASGVLSDKTLEQILAIWTGPWIESSFYKRLLSPGKAERSFAVADGVRPIADRLGATVSQVAIAWVLHQPGVAAAIAGSRNGSHVGENAAAANLDLTDSLEELERLIPLGPTFADEGSSGEAISAA
jgi:aryl-alcohol dehydrogenase-like predicted oxidoreductase